MERKICESLREDRGDDFVKQLTIISGKGGTGKTTIVAAFASLAKNVILADCDVDAPDLQLILKPEVGEEESYFGNRVAVREVDCSKCDICRKACRFDAIDKEINISETKCEGCGLCEYVCPEDAIQMVESETGRIFKSRTRFGPMVHTELKMGKGATGKLVTQVRQRAKNLADGEDLIIIDGSPGAGCPVIASITGVDQVLVVAEPTISGIFDLKRVLEVTEHFGIKSSVCINKYDINEENTKKIEDFCQGQGVPVVGKLPYDNLVTEAMINEQTVIEYSNSELSKRLEDIWKKVESFLGSE